MGHRDRAMLVDDLNSRPPPPRKLPVPRESPAPVIGSCKASCNDASVLPVQVPKRILNPHSTTTAAETSVAAINTLSREATLIVTLHFPAPGIGLVDSLKHRQSAPHIRTKVGRRLWFVGHRSEQPGALPGLTQKAPPNGALASVMPEQRDQQDDRQRHAQQPQQCAFREVHVVLLQELHVSKYGALTRQARSSSDPAALFDDASSAMRVIQSARAPSRPT